MRAAEVEKAQYAEKQAAASYTVALSDGDDANKQLAEKVLRLTSEARATVTQGKRGLAATAQALKKRSREAQCGNHRDQRGFERSSSAAATHSADHVG
jgi:hypothetical protein